MKTLIVQLRREVKKMKEKKFGDGANDVCKNCCQYSILTGCQHGGHSTALRGHTYCFAFVTFMLTKKLPTYYKAMVQTLLPSCNQTYSQLC